MKEQIKAPEKIQLSNEEIANLSDAQFKTLVIRILKKLGEYSRKMEEKVKAIKSEIKKNTQGTNSEGKETGTQINDLEKMKKEASNWNRMKKQEFFKNKERLRNLWDNFKHFNILIMGVPEGQEEEQEIENLFEQMMK